MQLNLTLGAANLEKTDKFYREILKLSPEVFKNTHSETTYLVLYFGEMKVVFQPLTDIEAQHPALLQNLTRTVLGVGMQLELSCDNLDDIYRMVHFYRWPVAYELEDREHHRRELWLRDPDGYLLVLNEE